MTFASAQEQYGITWQEYDTALAWFHSLSPNTPERLAEHFAALEAVERKWKREAEEKDRSLTALAQEQEWQREKRKHETDAERERSYAGNTAFGKGADDDRIYEYLETAQQTLQEAVSFNQSERYTATLAKLLADVTAAMALVQAPIISE